MTTTIQHESHPDAESLGAFAEQALGERERGRILEHLAICERCRQVVALAASAVEPASPAPDAARPSRSWWQGWGLALAPAAALAATVVFAVYLHLHRAGNSNQTAKVETPVQIAPAAVPEAGLTAANQTKTLQPASTRSQPAERAPEPAGTENKQTPAEPKSEEPAPVSNAAAQATLGESLSSAGGAASDKSLPAVAEWQQEQQKAAIAPVRSFASKAAAPAKPHDLETNQLNNNSLTSASAGAAVYNNQATGFVTTEAAPAGRRRAKGKEAPAILLPGGLPAVSVASLGSLTAALDATGALYLRPAAGSSWQRIAQQWTGRAVIVRNTSTGIQENGEDATRSAKIVSLAPAAFLEIVNDRNQTWLSTDGKAWVAR
jgi:hypothetical protein